LEKREKTGPRGKLGTWFPGSPVPQGMPVRPVENQEKSERIEASPAPGRNAASGGELCKQLLGNVEVRMDILHIVAILKRLT